MKITFSNFDTKLPADIDDHIENITCISHEQASGKLKEWERVYRADLSLIEVIVKLETRESKHLNAVDYLSTYSEKSH